MRRNGFTVLELIVSVATLAIVGFLVLQVGSKYTVSEGERSGILQKFSYKGVALKSWEGELAMPGIGKETGAWEFSVRDVALAEKLMELNGKAVTITYTKHPLSWGQDTNYTATAVKEGK